MKLFSVTIEPLSLLFGCLFLCVGAYNLSAVCFTLSVVLGYWEEEEE